MDQKILDRIEKVRRAFSTERDKALIAACSCVGEEPITAALLNAVASQRRLQAFLKTVEELSGIRRWTTESRRGLDYYLSSDQMKHRVALLKGHGWPPVELPAEALAIYKAPQEQSAAIEGTNDQEPGGLQDMPLCFLASISPSAKLILM
jgi:hypothetical protein